MFQRFRDLSKGKTAVLISTGSRLCVWPTASLSSKEDASSKWVRMKTSWLPEGRYAELFNLQASGYG